MRLRIGPVEEIGAFFLHGDNHHAGPKLRHAVVGCVQQPPVGLVPHFIKLGFQFFAVVVKHRIQKPAHVFDHHRAGAGIGRDNRTRVP